MTEELNIDDAIFVVCQPQGLQANFDAYNFEFAKRVINLDFIGGLNVEKLVGLLDLEICDLTRYVLPESHEYLQYLTQESLKMIDFSLDMTLNEDIKSFTQFLSRVSSNPDILKMLSRKLADVSNITKEKPVHIILSEKISKTRTSNSKVKEFDPEKAIKDTLVQIYLDVAIQFFQEIETTFKLENFLLLEPFEEKSKVRSEFVNWVITFTIADDRAAKIGKKLIHLDLEKLEVKLVSKRIVPTVEETIVKVSRNTLI